MVELFSKISIYFANDFMKNLFQVAHCNDNRAHQKTKSKQYTLCINLKNLKVVSECLLRTTEGNRAKGQCFSQTLDNCNNNVKFKYKHQFLYPNLNVPNHFLAMLFFII